MNFVCFLSLDTHIYHNTEKGKQENESFFEKNLIHYEIELSLSSQIHTNETNF